MHRHFSTKIYTRTAFYCGYFGVGVVFIHSKMNLQYSYYINNTFFFINNRINFCIAIAIDCNKSKSSWCTWWEISQCYGYHKHNLKFNVNEGAVNVCRVIAKFLTEYKLKANDKFDNVSGSQLVNCPVQPGKILPG